MTAAPQPCFVLARYPDLPRALEAAARLAPSACAVTVVDSAERAHAMMIDAVSIQPLRGPLFRKEAAK